ncbi:Multidrug resistance-associated protein [Aphelenchoides besseyi]|nr:Multidrug resistance-associated protein [Aphelenchoides besseyi]
MDNFCDTPLLPSITKNTSIPELFTPCLTFAVLPSIPLCFMISTFVVNGIASQIYSFSPISVNSNIARVKLYITLVSLLCSLVTCLASSLHNAFHFKERRIFKIGDLVFNLLAVIIYRLCLRLGFASSGFLHISWLLRYLILIPITVISFNNLLTFHDLYFGIMAISTLIELITAGALVVLFCYPDGVKKLAYERLEEKPQCPFNRSSAIQNAIYSYAGPLLKHSFKEKVDVDDFWQVDEQAEANHLRKKIDEYGKSIPNLWSLFWLLFRCSWTKHMSSILLGIVAASSRLVHTFFFAALLAIASGDYPYWLAFVPAVGLIVIDIVDNLCLSQLYLKGNLAYYSVRTTLISLIFDKMMRLSPSTQTNTATGVILNHITVDVQHSHDFWSDFRMFFYCPIVISISLFCLSLVVGVHNMLYGMVVLIAFQFIGLIVSNYTSRFTDKQMEFKDDRLKLINDILNGIRIIKLYAWEAPMEKITAKIRKREIQEILKSELLESILQSSFNLAPMLATILTFYMYIIVDGNKLNPSSAFLTLFLFDNIRFATSQIPTIFVTAVTTLVSMRRVLKFLQSEERSERAIKPSTSSDEFAVKMSNASFSWTNSLECKNLSNLTVNIRPGQLVGVIGSVGSGKSTLLSAIAGELEAIDGECEIRANSMAYIPQQAWIQNLTLRDNVLFSSHFDVDRYEKTLDACCLREDIMLLPSGDLTEIGEKGINLSGGQKARISLARSVYRKAEFYVLDDPFSALDANVGQQIFTNVIGPNGCLKDSTRIVALNSTSFLEQFDLIISLKHGKMVFCGPYSELHNASSTSLSVLSHSSSTVMNPEKAYETTEEQKRLVDTEFEEDTLVELEVYRAGTVKSEMYKDYIKAFGPILFVFFILFLMVGSTVTSMFAGLYVANWSSDEKNQTRAEALHNLIVYSSFNLGSEVFFIVAYGLLVVGCYQASVIFHRDLLRSILRAPMSFFEKTPLGRIVNRFSMDMELLDTSIGSHYGFTFIVLAEAFQKLLNVFVAIPILIPAIIPLVILVFFVTRFFNAASAQFRRISSNSMSHLCSAVQDAYSGASSIRVYGCFDRFREDFGRRLNQTVEANTVELISRLWVHTQMDFGTDFTVLFFFFAAIYFEANGWITLGLLGLIINSGVILCGAFGELADCYRTAETDIVCVERLKEYSTLEAEEIWKQPAKKTPLSSSVEFRNISLRYREQDDPVLHGVSFRVEQGERIGIVGRTGAGTQIDLRASRILEIAGKTSISSVLFRLVEPFEGEVLIGDVNIKDLGRTLRQILTIIPQDPVLFCGNLRSNLDPFEEYDDLQLWSALEKAHLSEFVHSLAEEGLDHEIADGGSNLSVGQRQLVCLARALLRTTSILVLDEATAAVDLQTDALVQQTIRDHFAHCTVLTIAHRLHTILDYDRVLVMQSGRVSEFDSPTALLAQPNGLFREFAQAAGIC